MDRSAKHLISQLKNSRGHTIFTILSMIVVIFAIVQVSFLQTVKTLENNKDMRILGVRDSLVSNMATYTTLGSTFRSSMHPGLPAEVNQELKNCIFGTGPGLCQAEVEMPLTLYYPISSADPAASTALQILSGTGAIGGASAQPAYYDERGRLCSLGSPVNCHYFQVWTTFTPHCAGGASSCSTATSISVRYAVSRATGSAEHIPLAPIEKVTQPLDRLKILPASASSSAKNVTVSLITVGQSNPSVSLQDIYDAIAAAGVTNPETIEGVGAAFYNTGYTDLTLITAISKVLMDGGKDIDISMVEKIEAFANLGITDIKTIEFMVYNYVPADVTWMKTVMEAGITDGFLARELYHTDISDLGPVVIRAIVDALQGAGVPDNRVAIAIANKGITDVDVVKKLADSVASIKDDAIAGGIIKGNHTDPAEIQKIYEALSGISSRAERGVLADLGISDASIIQQLVTILAPVAEWDNATILYESNGNPAKTLELVKQYVPDSYQWPTANQSVSTSTTATASSSTGDSSSGAGTSDPATITLIENCKTCSPVKF